MKKIFLLSFAALAALVSCNKEVPSFPQSDEIAFRLGGEFESVVMTRGASEVTTANLASLNVSATTGSSSETAAFTNIAFTKSGSTWTGGQYWPASNPSYHFYASNAALAHTAGGATVSPSNANTDIVAGYLASPTYKQVNTLTLDHIFAQVGTVTVKAQEGCSVSGLKISLQPVTAGTYNLKSGSWTTRGTAGSAKYLLGTASAGISLSAGGQQTSSDNDLWLLPGEYVLSCSYTITKGAASKTYNKTATVNLIQGKNNNLGLPDTDGDGEFDDPNITFDDSDLSEITFTVTVTPWTENTIPVSF